MTSCVVCEEKGTKVCSGCRSRDYCSKECQIKDWRSGHNKLCPAGKKKKENQPNFERSRNDRWKENVKNRNISISDEEQSKKAMDEIQNLLVDLDTEERRKENLLTLQNEIRTRERLKDERKMYNEQLRKEREKIRKQSKKLQKATNRKNLNEKKIKSQKLDIKKERKSKKKEEEKNKGLEEEDMERMKDMMSKMLEEQKKCREEQKKSREERKRLKKGQEELKVTVCKLWNFIEGNHNIKLRYEVGKRIYDSKETVIKKECQAYFERTFDRWRRERNNAAHPKHRIVLNGEVGLAKWKNVQELESVVFEGELAASMRKISHEEEYEKVLKDFVCE